MSTLHEVLAGRQGNYLGAERRLLDTFVDLRARGLKEVPLNWGPIGIACKSGELGARGLRAHAVISTVAPRASALRDEPVYDGGAPPAASQSLGLSAQETTPTAPPPHTPPGVEVSASPWNCEAKELRASPLNWGQGD